MAVLEKASVAYLLVKTWNKINGLNKSHHYLQLCVPFIHQTFEVESQISRQAVQILRGHFSTLQPLQVHHILLVMGDLKPGQTGLIRLDCTDMQVSYYATQILLQLVVGQSEKTPLECETLLRLWCQNPESGYVRCILLSSRTVNTEVECYEFVRFPAKRAETGFILRHFISRKVECLKSTKSHQTLR